MERPKQLPRILREPTGWFIIVLAIGFFYAQWPTREPSPETVDYVWTTLDNGFTARWEAKPQQQTIGTTQAWSLTRKGMSFLLQTGPLTVNFEDFVTDMVNQDRKTVGGAFQEPLEFNDQLAQYGLFDAESRVQQHRVYRQNGQWIKVSVLYKPSMESRVQRAAEFLNNAGFQTKNVDQSSN